MRGIYMWRDEPYHVFDLTDERPTTAVCGVAFPPDGRPEWLRVAGDDATLAAFLAEHANASPERKVGPITFPARDFRCAVCAASVSGVPHA